jgi:hypothetical protein
VSGNYLAVSGNYLAVSGNYSGPAVFIQDGIEHTVLVRYTVTLDPPFGPNGGPGMPSWKGTFAVEEGNLGIAPGLATLRLSDGSEGDILLTNVTRQYGAATPGVNGRFTGNGSPP